MRSRSPIFLYFILLAIGVIAACAKFEAQPQLSAVTGASFFPVKVISLPQNVEKLSAGRFHTCAYLSDNTGYCWGKNDVGQLGNGAKKAAGKTRMDPSFGPVPISVIQNITNIAAGDEFTCAIADPNDTVYCWGKNDSNQLGQGAPSQGESAPKPVLTAANTPLTNATGVTAGSGRACAIVAGVPWCWGNVPQQVQNPVTKLYNIQFSASLFAAKLVATIGGNWTGVDEIAMTQNDLCVLSSSAVACMGGDATNTSVPSLSGLPPTTGILAVQISGGMQNQICFVGQQDTTVFACFSSGQQRVPSSAATNGGAPDSSQPYSLSNGYSFLYGEPLLKISGKFIHTCGVGKNSQSITCWGNNQAGQTGNGNNGSPVPYPSRSGVARLGAVQNVTTGGLHTCALLTDATAWCWGDNTYGQLGRGTP